MTTSDSDGAAYLHDTSHLKIAGGRIGLRTESDRPSLPVSNTVGTPEVGDPEPSRSKGHHVPGEPGIWILLFGDMLIFTVLFTVYLDRRSHNRPLFAASQDHLDRTLGGVNTLVLLTGSILV